jgi:hypothetical protein
MKVYFGTVEFARPFPQGGEIVRLDWEKGSIEARASIGSQPSSGADGEHRLGPGGSGGVRLIADEVVVASHSALLFYGRDLVLRRCLSHGLMVGLHEIHTTGRGTIIVSATSIDAAVEYEISTGRPVRSFWPREMPELQARWGLTPLVIDKGADQRLRPPEPGVHRWRRVGQRLSTLASFRRRPLPGQAPSHTHLNAVTVWRDRTLALLAAPGAIVDLGSREVLIEDAGLRGAHNLVPLADGRSLAVNDTRGTRLCIYDLVSRRLVHTVELRSFAWVRDLERSSRAVLGRLGTVATLVEGIWNPVVLPLQARGLAAHEGLIWVGLSPAAIISIDLSRGTFEGGFAYSHDARQRVHGLAVTP